VEMMEKVFDAGEVDKVEVDFKKKPDAQIDRKDQHRVIWSVLIFVFILFLALGWVNFQAGRSFKVPATITYKNAVYETEGEIITDAGLVKTGQKVYNLQIYVEKVERGRPDKIYVKAGEDYVVYILKESK
jgi:hypothetical protein